MLFRRLDALPAVLIAHPDPEWRELLPSIEPLRAAVREAHRVVFARSASAAAHDLSEDRAALERARPQIFAPFERTWVEFAPVPHLGVLWQSDPGEHKRGSLIVVEWPAHYAVPIMYQFEADLVDPFAPPFRMTERSHRAVLAAAEPDGDGREVGTRAEMDAWVAAPALAAFALMATKGMTASIEADLRALNRARTKAGKYPLLGFTEVRLNLDVERQLRPGHGRAVATGTMPQHTVRAHLRLLPTGKVTIVRSHMRGNPTYGVRRAHYTVMRAEDAP
jgi:hypothetical protein